MAVNMRPVRDKVIVERVEAEDKTSGGIILPETAKDKPQQGVVVAVGQGKVLESGKIKEPEVQKGDRVIFGSYSGTEVKVSGREYLILSESELLAVVEDDKKK